MSRLARGALSTWTVLAIVFPASSEAATGTTVSQKVKTAVGYENFDENGQLTPLPGACSCVVTGFTAQSPPPIIGGPDPGVETPASQLIAINGCPVGAGSGPGALGLTFDFKSLHDLGTWTITCDGQFYDQNYCYAGTGCLCNICCNPLTTSPWANPFVWTVNVWNDPPTASPTILPAPQFGTQQSFFHAHSSDADGGTLTHRWTMIKFPPRAAGHILPPSAYGSGSDPGGISFTLDIFIGDWEMQLDVIDEVGEQKTFYIPFTVPNLPPTLSVSPTSLTIDVLSDIVLNATSTDPDGGTPTIKWEIVQSPPRSHPTQTTFTGNTLDLPTGEGDNGTWVFKVSATDDDNAPNSTVSQNVTVTVNNLPPEIQFEGLSQIKVGDAIHVRTIKTLDRDGNDPLQLSWDLVQVPHSAGVPIQNGLFNGDTIDIPTTAKDAGTWIFRLNATDNDNAPNSTVTQDFSVLVDAPPTAKIDTTPAGGDPLLIASKQFPLTFDSSGSVDPDSPCPNDPNHCHDTDGRPAQVSPGIVEQTWYLIDVSPENALLFPTGRVDDVFHKDGSSPTLSFGYFELAQGDFTFQIQVVDGEGNVASDQRTIDVIASNTPPTPIVSAPSDVLTDVNGVVAQDVIVSGHNSYDLDNILAGGTITPGLGITNYAWTATPPPGCPAPALPSGPNADTITLFSAGSTVPLNCHGAWTIQLTVTDDDSPALTASTTTVIVIGNCAGLICIDSPTTAQPQRIDFSDNTDVLVLYHLNSAVYANSALQFGMFAELNIYHESDLVTPFYTSTDPNVLASDANGFPVFHWNGFGNPPAYRRPLPGRYNVVITLLDYASAASTLTTSQPASIIIAVADVNVSPTYDRYVKFDDLDSGAKQLKFDWTIGGGTTVDTVVWRVKDAAGTPVMPDTGVAVAASGTVTWDGKVGGVTVAPGDYTFEIEAQRSGAVLGRSTPAKFTVYRLGLSPGGGPVPADGWPVFVNVDDDDWNGVADLMQVPAAAGEDDLLPLTLNFLPAMNGTLILSSDNGALIKVYSDAGKTSQLVLPQLYTTPADTVPPILFVEGQAAGKTNLKLVFTPADPGAIAPETAKLRLYQIDLMLDSNNDHAITPADSSTFWLQIARWDSAYGPAPAFDVANAADPANFIEQDPSRFYLRVTDPVANTDATTAEALHVNLGTLDSLRAANDVAVDETLVETGPDTGIFVSRSQLLTSNDLSIPAPTPPNKVADDVFAASDGVGGTVADNAAGDRTHRADIDGAIQYLYTPSGSAIAKGTTLPVCQRTPEMRHKVQLRTHVFLEPFHDVGVGGVGAGNHVFDFTDTNGNGVHDAGEPSEPYLDISSGAATFHRGDDVGVADGRGPVTPAAALSDQLTRANLAWAPACLRFEQTVLAAEAAPKVGGVDIIDDGDISYPWEVVAPAVSDCETIYNTYSATMTPDILEVFYAADQTGNAISLITAYQAGFAHGDKAFVIMSPKLDITLRTLAHELGHQLGNIGDSATDQTIFFPNNHPVVAGGDAFVNIYRRFSQATQTRSTTVRAIGDLTGAGNAFMKAP
jgi:hypothetical protein